MGARHHASQAAAEGLVSAGSPAPQGRGRPRAADKSKPIDSNLLAKPKGPRPEWMSRPELLPRRPPGRP